MHAFIVYDKFYATTCHKGTSPRVAATTTTKLRQVSLKALTYPGDTTNNPSSGHLEKNTPLLFAVCLIFHGGCPALSYSWSPVMLPGICIHPRTAYINY